MRRGARDYVLKDNLTRLLPALRRELEEARLRREQRRLEAQAAAAERERARLAEVLEATPDLVAIADPEGRLRFINRAGRDLLGLGQAALDGRCLHDLFSEHVAAHLLGEAFPAACRDGHWVGEIAVPAPAGCAEIPLSKLVVAHRDAAGEIDYLSIVARDISERRKFEAELQHQATHDRLTGLPNRFLLIDRLEAELAHVRRHGGFAAVLFFDLDNFKRVNDSLGHAAGDAVLRQVAARMQGCLRPTDTVARHGGDEFTVAVGDLQRIEDVLAVLRKVRAAFELPVTAGSQEVFVSFSIGIAVFPHDGSGVETLLRNADTAMYRAKAAGRNQYRFYAPDMNERGHELLALEAELRRAVERREFELFYQPQVELASGCIRALEALIRWRHPRRGLVSPAEFLPLLEDTGLIVPVGQWVVQRACADLRAWRRTRPDLLRVSVNVSVVQFADPELATRVGAALVAEQVPAGGLELEITENLLMRDPGATGAMLRRLHALGVRVAVDDFGVGYSSLAYLKHFPLDVIKIDRTFVADLIRDADDAAIVEAAISLGHKLGLEVVAEGVETEAQYHFLRDHGCDLAQGYFCCPPLPAAEVDTFLAAGR
ncbi:MAG: putative bifunctional diguanylate cyclase/phosphodiesterase [Pseudomonadota bacterium]